MLDVIESRLFVSEAESSDNQFGKVPDDSTLAMTSGHFQVAGEVMATSIVQGGPAPDFLTDWVYQYLSSGINGITFDETKIKNQSVRQLIDKLKSVDTDQAFQDLFMSENVLDELSTIGYRGVPHRESLKNRNTIIRYDFVIDLRFYLPEYYM